MSTYTELNNLLFANPNEGKVSYLREGQQYKIRSTENPENEFIVEPIFPTTLTKDQLIPVDGINIDYIIEFDGEFFTSDVVLGNLDEAEAGGNPFYRLEHINVFSIDIGSLIASNETAQQEIDSTSNFTTNIEGIGIIDSSGLNIEDKEVIIRQIAWTSSDPSSTKSKSELTETGEWEIDIDGQSEIFTFDNRPGPEVYNEGIRSANLAFYQTVIESGIETINNIKNNTAGRPPNFKPSGAKSERPIRLIPDSSPICRHRNPGFTEILVAFGKRNWEAGAKRITVIINETSYTFTNAPDVLLGGVEAFIIEIKGPLRSLRFLQEEIRFPGLLNDGYGLFHYKVLSKDGAYNFNRATPNNIPSATRCSTARYGALWGRTGTNGFFGSFPNFWREQNIITLNDDLSATGKVVIMANGAGENTQPQTKEGVVVGGWFNPPLSEQELDSYISIVNSEFKG